MLHSDKSLNNRIYLLHNFYSHKLQKIYVILLHNIIYLNTILNLYYLNI